MPSTPEQRRTYFVDAALQGAIMRQAVYYWVLGMITFTVTVFIYRIVPQCLSGQPLSWNEVWYHLAPTVVSTAVLLPIVLFSAMRFSHRFAGPVIRFRRSLQILGQGKVIPPIQLRQNDFWTGLANDINQVSIRLRETQQVAMRTERERADDTALEDNPVANCCG